MQLANTTAIVTGGASGLGAATAAALAAQGARVVALDLPDACIDRAAAVEGVEYVATDVTVRGAGARPPSRRRPTTGAPLRTVVNCAGIGPSARILGRKGVHDLGAVPQGRRDQPDRLLHRPRGRRRGDRAPPSPTRRPARRRHQHRRASPPSTARSARPPTPPPRAASSASPCRPRATWRSTASGCSPSRPASSRRRCWRPSPTSSGPALAAGVPFPQRLARPEEYAEARARDRRPRLPQRRDDPDGRRAADGPALTRSHVVG